MKLPTITRSEIRTLADSDAIYLRGVDYFQAGRVGKVDFVDNVLTAEVLGSQGDYKVGVVWKENRIARTSCTCPYDGYVCKHIVAVLLTLCEDISSIAQAVADKERKQESLTDLLSGLSNNQLLEIIAGVARAFPEVTTKVLSLAEKLGAANTPEAASAFAGEQAISLWSDLEVIVSEFDQYGGGPDDEENQAYDLFYELEEVLKKKAVPSDDREMIIEECCRYLQSGNSGFDDSLLGLCFAAANKPAHWRQLIAGLEPLARQRESGYYRNVLNRIYLERLGDEETYLRERQKALVYGSDYLELAQFWKGKGEIAKAVEIAETGMKEGKGNMRELRSFLLAEYESMGRQEEAFELRLQSFEESPSLSQYQAIKKETKKESWPAIEKRLTKALDAAPWPGHETMKIRLFRREYQPVLEYLRRQADSWRSWGWTSENGQLAKSVANHYPDEIVDLYRALVQRSIKLGNRKAYRAAAWHAKEMKSLMSRIPGGIEEFRKFIHRIREENPRRPALLEEFSDL